MDTKDIAQRLHPLERKVMPALMHTGYFEELIVRTGLQEVEVMRALQWMENKGLILLDKKELEMLELEKNGRLCQERGMPEKRFLSVLEKGPLRLQDLGMKGHLDKNELNISMGQLKRQGAIEIKGLMISITEKGRALLKEKSAEERFLEHKFPLDYEKSDKKTADILVKRGLLKKARRVVVNATLTELGKEVLEEDLETQVIDKLTQRVLKDKSWKHTPFRKYDVEINVPQISGGRRHFTNQVVEYIKSVWLELGFVEMTGNIVQSSFWDLDALFVPQDHPAREMQDTFYLKDPRHAKLPSKFVEQVRKTHEDGWTTGSRGWGGVWSRDKAKENLLRTHTTVLSAQTLTKLKKADLPAKYFSVGKCFRNEALDWKHLFEFYQVEGIVVDPDANFENLVGYLKNFFAKMGFPDVRVRPGHFPYTEPSAEVDVWHPVKKEWMEIGGSGIFRPEVTKPLMGFEVPVLAWGLGLGRLIMEYWQINDLRQYYKNDLRQLREMKVWLR